MLLFFLFLIVFLEIIVISLRFEFEIENFSYSNMLNKTPDNFCIKVRIYIFNKIKFLEIKLDNQKLKKIYSKQKVEKIDTKKMMKRLPKSNKEKLNLLKKINLQKLDLNFEIGSIDIMLTTSIIPILSSFLSYFLVKAGNRNCKYRIMPIYVESFVYKIDLNCIFSLKMIHIINIMWLILRKRDDKNGRTSNRRFNAYSYE